MTQDSPPRGNGHNMTPVERLHAEAERAYLAGDLDEARRQLARAMDRHDAVGDRTGCATTQHQLAVVEYQAGATDAARTLLEQSLATKRELRDPEGMAISLHMLGHLETTAGNHDRAAELLEEAVACSRELNHPEALAANLMMLCQHDGRRGDFQTALAHAREGVALLRAAGSEQLADGEGLLGQLEEAAAGVEGAGSPGRDAIARVHKALEDGDGEQACVLAEAALALARDSGNEDDEAASGYLLANALLMVGKVADAQPHLERSKAILDAAGNDKEAQVVGELLDRVRAATGESGGAADSALARAHQALEDGELEAALSAANDALDRAREAGNGGDEAIARFLLGQGLLGLGRAQEAIPQLEQSLAILEPQGFDREVAVVKGLLARAKGTGAAGTTALEQAAAALREREPDRALAVLEPELPGLEQEEDPRGWLRALALKAQAQALKGQVDEANALMDETIARAEKANLTEDITALRKVREHLLAHAAVELLARTPTETIRASAAGPAELAERLAEKAGALAARGDLDGASGLCDEALAAAERAKNPQALLQALFIKGQVHGARGEADPALEAIARARDLAKEQAPGLLPALENIESQLRKAR